MSSDWPAEAMLACVRASPEAVAAHNRAAWLGLFAEDAEIHDPVGSHAHSGPETIARFYDTFIAPNDVRFEVAHELACGDTVIRDVVIHTRMATGLELGVPAHIRYELTGSEDALRVRRLCAHWELPQMIGQSLRAGIKGMRSHAALSSHMLRHQGLGGMLGFMRASGGVGSRGKTRAEGCLRALRDGHCAGLSRCFGEACRIQMPGQPEASPEELAATLGGLFWEKLIAAGNCVTATIHIGEKRGIALFRFNGPQHIEQLRIYL